MADHGSEADIAAKENPRRLAPGGGQAGLPPRILEQRLRGASDWGRPPGVDQKR
jgi:hypothetical protein